MIELLGTVANIAAVKNMLGSAKGDALKACTLGVSRGVLGGMSIVRGNASGRPGPRNVTGDFRRTIVADWEVKGETVFGQIGTNAAQARRLEYGFVGADVLGRNYNQPPYPYMGPSVTEVEKLVRDQVATEIAKEFG